MSSSSPTELHQYIPMQMQMKKLPKMRVSPKSLDPYAKPSNKEAVPKVAPFLPFVGMGALFAFTYEAVGTPS